MTVWLTKIVCHNVYTLFLGEFQTMARRTLGLECLIQQKQLVQIIISEGSDHVNKHQVSINFNEFVDPTHTVCAELNQGNESVFGMDQMQENNVLLTYILVSEIDLFTIATPS